MSSTVPSEIRAKVKEGLPTDAPDPNHFGSIKTLHEATESQREHAHRRNNLSDDVDIYYYEVQVADLDIGYDKRYHGFVYRDGSRVWKDKLGEK